MWLVFSYKSSRGSHDPVVPMRALKLAVAFGVFAQALASPLWAADVAPVLSLPQLLEEVRQANPTLREARTRWEAAKQRIPLSTALPAPKIGVEFEDIPRGSIKVNQATIMYQLIQSIPFPGKLSARHQIAVKESQIAAMQFKQAELTVTSDLKTAYYDVFLLERELELQQEQLVWLNQATTAAQARYATGAGSQIELLRVQSDTLQASNALTVLMHRRQALTAHLNHLLNRPTHEPIGHPEPIALIPVTFTPDELLLIAQERQPELLMMRYAVEKAQASVKLAKRELLPDLETMFELRDPAMGPIGPWDLSLAVVVPFWFWTKLKYGVKGALYDQQSMEAASQAMRNEIARRVHENWHEAQAAYATAKLCQDGLIPLARETVASAMASYQSGQGSLTDVLEALRALTEQRRTYAQHLVALEQRVVMLEQAVGIPLRSAHEAPATGGPS